MRARQPLVLEATLLLVVLLFAGWTRLSGLGTESLWMSELWAVSRTSPGARDAGLPRDVVLEPAPDTTSFEARAENDPPPTTTPVFDQALRLLRQLWARNDESRMRMLSALASLATVALVHQIGRLSCGPAVGLAAAALLAAAGTPVYYAHELRSPALATFLVSCVALGVARISRRGASPLWLLALLVSVALALGSDPWTSSPLLALLAWASFRSGHARRWLTLSTAAVGLALALSGGATSPLEAALGPAKSGDSEPVHFPLPEILERLARIPRRLISEPPSDWNRGFFWKAEVGFDPRLNPVRLPIGALEALAALAFAAPWLAGGKRREELWLPWAWLVGGVGLALLRDLCADDVQLFRLDAASLASPAAPLLLAILLPRGRAALAAATLCLAALFSTQVPAAAAPGKADLRGLGQFVAGGGPEAGVLLIEGGAPASYIETLQRAVSHGAPSASRPLLLARGAASASDLQRLGRAGQGVFVVAATDATSPADWLPSGFVLLDSADFEGAGRVWRIALSRVLKEPSSAEESPRNPALFDPPGE